MRRRCTLGSSVWLALFQWGAGLTDHTIHALTLSSELPFVLSSAELAAVPAHAPSGATGASERDLLGVLETLQARRDRESSPNVEAVLALCRTLLGVSEARRHLDAIQGSETALVALIERLIRKETLPDTTDPSARGSALPLMLGPVPEVVPDAAQSPQPAPDQPSIRIRVRFLGRFSVEIDGTALPGWRSRRARQLFQYLLLNHGEEVSRYNLMGLFWPDHSEERAENNLSLTVMTLRRVLEQAAPGMGACVVYRSGAYLFEHAGLWMDIDAFSEAIERARRFDNTGDVAHACEAFDEALALYGGGLLPGEMYEEWTLSRRQRLEDRFMEALQRRATMAREHSDFALSIRLNHRALEIDPALEAVHRQLILDYLETGQRSRAVQQIDACREALLRHLGEVPDAESLAVFARVNAPINQKSITVQG